ncbi:hypothetical protein V502_11351 [Pseudogymnoascus sp. VKM F-4520 (FW-2644)]|nr:hypothetical protein V502_11351 [Pseudogymnoascus sp. VKM F-4520 (FW-2644)]
MRATIRLFASVKPSRYLEAGAPTGLTGLFTHPAPRSALIYLYSSTLEKLKRFPEDSVYRKSTEALTKQRLQIVESVVPEGFAAWQEKLQKLVKENPDVFTTPKGAAAYMGGMHVKETMGGNEFVTSTPGKVYDEQNDEWDGEKVYEGELEGTRTEAERKSQADLAEERPQEETRRVELDDEPSLTAEQIGEIEDKIGAGLIEEVIDVAQGELNLVDTMEKSKIWEDLEEKPVEGQWVYFERK